MATVLFFDILYFIALGAENRENETIKLLLAANLNEEY